jgi:hypothetical protein
MTTRYVSTHNKNTQFMVLERLLRFTFFVFSANIKSKLYPEKNNLRNHYREWLDIVNRCDGSSASSAISHLSLLKQVT